MTKTETTRDRPRMGKPVRFRVVEGNGEKDTPPTGADRTYFRELHGIIDKVFSEAADSFGWTWSQLAWHSGLGYTTVADLGDRKTRWPRFSTVWRLCKAVGWDLDIKESKSQKTIVLRKIA